MENHLNKHFISTKAALLVLCAMHEEIRVGGCLCVSLCVCDGVMFCVRKCEDVRKNRGGLGLRECVGIESGDREEPLPCCST